MSGETGENRQPIDRSIRRNDPARELVHPVLQRLYAYWLGKCAGRFAPSRVEIDPVDFPYAVGWAALIDVVDDGASFSVRVWGGKMKAFSRGEYTGQSNLQFLDADIGTKVLAGFRWVVANRKPAATLRDIETSMRHYRFESLVLPLSDDGETVTQLLTAAIPPVGG